MGPYKAMESTQTVGTTISTTATTSPPADGSEPCIVPYDKWAGMVDTWTFRKENGAAAVYEHALTAIASTNLTWAQPSSTAGEAEKERNWAAKAPELVTVSNVCKDGTSVVFFSALEKDGWVIPLVLPPPRQLEWRAWSKTKRVLLKEKIVKVMRPERHRRWYDEAVDAVNAEFKRSQGGA